MADHDRIWERLENSFGERRWNSIVATWPQFVGAPIDPPGSAPELTLSDLLQQGGVLVNLPTKNELTSVDHPRGEIPYIIFREAVFWLHKACHVLGASEAHVDMGMPTWSISAAY